MNLKIDKGVAPRHLTSQLPERFTLRAELEEWAKGAAFFATIVALLFLAAVTFGGLT